MSFYESVEALAKDMGVPLCGMRERQRRGVLRVPGEGGLRRQGCRDVELVVVSSDGKVRTIEDSFAKNLRG